MQNNRLLIGCLIPLLLVSCQPIPETDAPETGEFEQFAIYLTLEKFVLQEQIDLADIKLSDQPLIANDDIDTYNFATHEIRLSASAKNRLSDLDLAGRPFVLTIAEEPIYAGEFMAAYMSRSSERVVILWPPMDTNVDMKIQLGYPGPDFFVGEDPRSDPRIQTALSNAGKLQ